MEKDFEENLFFDDEIQDDKLVYIKGKFFNNIFNPIYINDSFDYCYPYQGRNEKHGNKLIHKDPVFATIAELKHIESENSENILPNKEIQLDTRFNTSAEFPSINNKIPMLTYSTNTNNSNEKFLYTKEMDSILTNKFAEFGLFKDFETLMRSATQFYEQDQISAYDSLLQKNKILREIILSKMDLNVSPDATLRFQLESAMISLAFEEIDKRINKYHKLILQENRLNVSLNYKHEKLKIYFEKEYATYNINKLIRMLYEIDSYHNWLPFISKVKTIKYLSKSKKVSHLSIDFPVIQERDLVLYSFINNRLKDSKTIQFLSKSADEEECLKFRDTIIKRQDDIRVDLINSSFEIKIEKDKLILAGYIHLDPRLKYLNNNFIEILVRQYTKKMFSNIDEVLNLDDKTFNRKIKKNLVKAESIDFYNFIYKELKKCESNELEIANEY